MKTKRTFKFILVIFTIFIVSNASFADIINIPADQPTIQDGINAAMEGDTVLVQPGIYVEYITFKGKAITVASYFLTTPNPVYIEQTVIDGNNESSVIFFQNSEDTTSVLSGFTITNGNGWGGGIKCESSSPTLRSLIIKNNTSGWTGGGIYCDSSSPVLQDLVISNNTTTGSSWGTGAYGGGIACYDESNPTLQNVIVSNDSARYGGGIYCENSSPILQNVTIIENYGRFGGGICCSGESYPVLDNVTICSNSSERGGGISCRNGSGPVLQNVSILDNIAHELGGGLYCDESYPVFDSINPCNIYMNNAFQGNDLYSNIYLEVITDTFTVLYPTDYHVFPTENFHFKILHGKLEQLDADLYVSPMGENSNSGLSINDPLRNISHALSIILSDSLNPHSIYLLDGTYSSALSGEIFPVSLINYISIIGESKNGTILDAEQQAAVMVVDSRKGVLVSGLTISGGSGDWMSGGGITCNNSSPTFNDLNISNNSSDKGGGMSCSSSNPTLNNITISSNNSSSHGFGGGGLYCYGSSPVLNHVIISDNNAGGGNGGGIACLAGSNPVLEDVTITGNIAESFGGGLYCTTSNPSLHQVTISANTANQGGGIYCDGNSTIILNDSLRSNIYFNNANLGNDLYSVVYQDIILDTFSVLLPTAYHATPLENFSFDILNAKFQQLDADVFVAPYGDNNNSGITADFPLKTISFAMQKIISSELNQNTIRLLEGVYSPSTNEEVFPLYIPDYYAISGESEESVILDAEGLSRVITFENNEGGRITDLTITGGTEESGAGIYCYSSEPFMQNVTVSGNTGTENHLGSGAGICCSNSSPVMMNVTISNNSNVGDGGGISCHNSSPLMQEVIISGNSAYHGGGMICTDSSNAQMVNVYITGNDAIEGGGLLCTTSNPVLQNVVISNNLAHGYFWSGGGGILCLGASPVLEDVTISENVTTNSAGAGIACRDGSNPLLKNVTISSNSASNGGGGLFCWNSSPELQNVIISDNNSISGYGGGGIQCREASNPTLQDVIITNNTSWAGGGIFVMEGSEPVFKNVTIKFNRASERGGGIYCYDAYPVFDSISRCNIYLNQAILKNDIHSDTYMEVIVDTFTVLYPTDYHAAPLENFNFDILHGKLEQVVDDLYVSTGGENSNSGLSVDDPLKNIIYALSKSVSDSLNPQTIYLLNGTYNRTLNGDHFPINIPDYVSISGGSESETILDAEGLSSIIRLDNNNGTYISNLTFTNGISGAIRCDNFSDPIIEDIRVIGNSGGIYCSNGSNPAITNATVMGNTDHGIFCYDNSSPGITNSIISNNSAENGGGVFFDKHSDPMLVNVEITNNTAISGAGVYCDSSSPGFKNCLITGNVSTGTDSIMGGGGITFRDNCYSIMENVTISDNTAISDGGGIHCIHVGNPVLKNVQITGNFASNGGGVYCDQYSDISLQNATITENIASEAGAAIYSDADITVLNTIIWNNFPDMIYGIADVAFSNIQDGWLGEGNIFEDPLFSGYGEHPFSLLPASPCIDSGTPDTSGLSIPDYDIMGNPRIWNKRIDMGAYEWNNVGFDDPDLINENITISISPNPVIEMSEIIYELPFGSPVELSMNDMMGKKIRTLVDMEQNIGKYIVPFDGTDLPAGLYLLRLQAGEYLETVKILIMR